MKKPMLLVLGLALIGAGYWAGVRRAQPPSDAPASAASRKILYYRNPMDPSVHSPTPAQDSMGMDYVPVYADEASAGPTVTGRATIEIPLERQRLLGVHSEALRVQPLERSIRTVGRVAVDERLVHHVHTKYDGYVDHLYVDFTGRFVKKDEPLLSIYSPDLVATQQEYLLAYRARRELAAGGDALAAQGGLDLLEATRRRLLLWDIRAEDIAALEKAGTVTRTLDLHSETSGYVVQKMAFHGMRITPMDTLYDIADLSHLWILADVYESDLSSIRLGMRGDVTVTYLAGQAWSGPVTYIAPTVEEKTRTIKVRIEVENRGGTLKPDMFADVQLRDRLGEGLIVPDNAVIDAGDRKLVFLDLGDGRLEPRQVKLGAKVGAGFQVLDGIAAGDRVVTQANFLIDSESSLRAALQAFQP